MSAVSVGTPVLSEELGNMSNVHCYMECPLSLLSSIPFSFISCTKPRRWTVNLMHVCSPTFIGFILLWHSLFLPAGNFYCYRWYSVFLEEAKGEGFELGLLSAVIWGDPCFSLGGGSYHHLSSLNIRLPHLCNFRTLKMTQKGGFFPLSVDRLMLLFQK